MHVDNYNPETYMWILKEIDIPYIPGEWNNLLEKCAKNIGKTSGAGILGRYISKMRLIQYKQYRFADSEMLQEKERVKRERALQMQGKTEEEAREQALLDEKGPERPKEEESIEQVEEPEIELAEEQISYFRLKWGKSYRPSEWL